MTPEESASLVDGAFFRNVPWRLRWEINFDQENRLRVLEGKPAVTRRQYRQGVINWVATNFNPDAIDLP